MIAVGRPALCFVVYVAGIYQHFQSSSVATTARTSSSRISSAIGTCSYSVPALIGSTSHIASLSRASTTPIGANLYHNPVSFSSTSILRALKENSVSAPSATSGSVHPLPGSALQRTKTVSSFFQQKSTQPITVSFIHNVFSCAKCMCM